MASIWDRLVARTRVVVQSGFRSGGGPLKDSFYEDLEEALIEADVGPRLAEELCARVRALLPRTYEEARSALVKVVSETLSPASRELTLVPEGLTCILLFGVNGAGKTTSCGKLAHRLRAQGRNPILIAADTYRAAGKDQALIWAERAGVAGFGGAAGADPASVVFDGLSLAAARGHDVAVIDTAGRLHNQANLLNELAKVARVAGRVVPGAPHESLLVLDAVLGQSNLSQAEAFHKVIPLTGLVLTKLDSSARGGSLLAVETRLSVPVKLVGTGESLQDLAPFAPLEFAESLFGLERG